MNYYRQPKASAIHEILLIVIVEEAERNEKQVLVNYYSYKESDQCELLPLTYIKLHRIHKLNLI